MPAGPSIVILGDQVTSLLGQTIERVSGNTKKGHLGRSDRRSVWCGNCQLLYA